MDLLQAAPASLSKSAIGRGSGQCSDTFRFSQSDFQEGDEIPELSLENDTLLTPEHIMIKTGVSPTLLLTALEKSLPARSLKISSRTR